MAQPSVTSMSAAIEVRGVTQRFGGLEAVSQVTFSIAKGTIHGIIGPNGAGKTTLLNILSGLQPPTEGRVFVDGAEVTGWRSHRLVSAARLVRTFQTVRLFGSMTVLENVLVAARAVDHSAAARQTADRVLTRLQLLELKDKPATSLSYGLQRRVELARVIAANPAVVLLDEPAAGLNPQERQELANLLTELRSDHKLTVVLVEHHMDLVHLVCEFCTVLDFGRVISSGTPDEVTRDPAVLEAYLGRRHEQPGPASPVPSDHRTGQDPT